MKVESTLFRDACAIPGEGSSGDHPLAIPRRSVAPSNSYRWFDRWTATGDELQHVSGFAVRITARGEEGLVKVGTIQISRGRELMIMATPDALQRLKFVQAGNYKRALRRLVGEAEKFWRHRVEHK